MMRLVVTFLLLALSAGPAWAVTTNFDGTENPLSEGGTWTTVTGAQPLQKISGIVSITTGDGMMYWTGTALSDNQRSRLVVEDNANIGGPTCRNNGTGFYAYHAGNGAGTIRKWSSSSSSAILISTTTATVSQGDTVTLECTGTTTVTLVAKVNSTTVGTVQDSSSPFQTGQPGIYIAGSTTRSFTSWTGEEILPDVTPPTDPTNLSCAGATSFQIDCSWTASTDDIGVSEYRVEVSAGADCSAFAEVAQPTGTTYSITGLAGSTTRCTRVRAYDGTNFSGYTAGAQATTLAVRSVKIAWTDNASTEDSFEIWRCVGDLCTSHTLLDTVAANVVQYVDSASPLPEGCYKVKAALSGSVGSAFTNSWCTTVQGNPSLTRKVKGWRR